jgi:DNA-binding NarL/FixJ family response regulator
MIRLIVTDDHPVIRNGIKAILESVNDIQIVAEVSDGEELMQLLESPAYQGDHLFTI